MAVFLKWKECKKCGYTGNMDCWKDKKLGRICSCPICSNKIYENNE